MTPDKPYRIREWRPSDDGAFVVDAWRMSFHNGGPAVQYADRDHLKDEMRRVIDRIIDNGAKVLIACDAEDEDALVGFASATSGELHYVYIRGGDEKVTMRKQGIARDLIESIGPIFSYTFSTLAGIRRLRPRDRGWKFTPRFTL